MTELAIWKKEELEKLRKDLDLLFRRFRHGFGEVQAIGGVNQKIEGFYDCCRHKGFNGEQGVMIPRSNIRDLMLRKDVVAAVRDGRFTIYAIQNIDEGIEILTGTPAGGIQADGGYPEGTINFLVDRKLKELAESIKDYGRGEEAPGRSGKCQSC